jgi:hypothetical protein
MSGSWVAVGWPCSVRSCFYFFQGIGAMHVSVWGENAQLPWVAQRSSEWAATSWTVARIRARLVGRLGLRATAAALFCLGNCVVGESCTGCWAPAPNALACETGRTCCVDNCW